MRFGLEHPTIVGYTSEPPTLRIIIWLLTYVNDLWFSSLYDNTIIMNLGVCMVRKTMWVVMTFLALSIAGYVLVLYGVIGANQAPLIQGKLEEITLSSFYYVLLYLHIVSSVVALVIGPFTLSKTFREKNIGRHRKLGKIYMLGVMIGGISGYYLAFHATGGLVGKLGFGTLSVLWLTTAYLALKNIRNIRVENHQRWMIRNYALTFAAVTLRLYIIMLLVFIGEEHFAMGYPIIAWLCWVPNLITAELFIRSRVYKVSRGLPG